MERSAEKGQQRRDDKKRSVAYAANSSLSHFDELPPRGAPPPASSRLSRRCCSAAPVGCGCDGRVNLKIRRWWWWWNRFSAPADPPTRDVAAADTSAARIPAACPPPPSAAHLRPPTEQPRTHPQPQLPADGTQSGDSIDIFLAQHLFNLRFRAQPQLSLSQAASLKKEGWRTQRRPRYPATTDTPANAATVKNARPLNCGHGRARSAGERDRAHTH